MNNNEVSKGINIFVKCLLSCIAFILALCIFSIQLSKPASIMVVGLFMTIAITNFLDIMDRKAEKPSLVLNNSPQNFELFMGKHASYFLKAVIYPLFWINIIWALRWFSGVNSVISGIYGVSQEDIDTLATCGNDHPYIIIWYKFCGQICNY